MGHSLLSCHPSRVMSKNHESIMLMILGDSGTPLILKNDSTGEWNLIGTGSWNSQMCEVDGRPQGFSNLFTEKFNQWIKTTAKLE